MSKKVALIIISIVGIFIFLPTLNASAAFTLFNNSCKDSAGNAVNSSVCKDAARTGIKDPIAGKDGIIQTAANLIALVTGIAAVIVIIISGFIFVTAGGTGFKSAAGGAPTRAAKARGALTGAIIGLAIVALAWALTTFIISRFVNS